MKRFTIFLKLRYIFNKIGIPWKRFLKELLNPPYFSLKKKIYKISISSLIDIKFPKFVLNYLTIWLFDSKKGKSLVNSFQVRFKKLKLIRGY